MPLCPLFIKKKGTLFACVCLSLLFRTSRLSRGPPLKVTSMFAAPPPAQCCHKHKCDLPLHRTAPDQVVSGQKITVPNRIRKKGGKKIRDCIDIERSSLYIKKWCWVKTKLAYGGGGGIWVTLLFLSGTLQKTSSLERSVLREL